MNFQPHVHVLCADEVFRANGTFVPLPPIPEALLERGFRRAVLDFLVRERAISEELCGRMLGWRYSGFSVHNQVRVAAEDAEGRKKLAAYMLRAPLSLAKMSYDAASGTLNLPLEDAPWAQAQLPGDAGRPVAGAALQAYSRSLRATRQVRGLVLEPQSRSAQGEGRHCVGDYGQRRHRSARRVREPREAGLGAADPQSLR